MSNGTAMCDTPRFMEDDMTESEKIYLITFRHDAPQPSDWQSSLSKIPGLRLLSTTGRYARITCTAETLTKARATLGHDAIIEEEIPRYL